MSAPLIPEQFEGPATPLYKKLVKAQRLVNSKEFTRKEMDAYLLSDVGMTLSGLRAAIGAMPKEIAKGPLTTEKILKAEAYGLSAGYLDEMVGLIGALRGTGYKKARDAVLKEMAGFERDYPWLARTAKAYGAVAGAIGLGTTATTANILRGGGAGAFGSLLRSGKALSAIREISPALGTYGLPGRIAVGTAFGAAAGSGGLMGEPDASRPDMLMQRGQGAAAGALSGAGAALAPEALRLKRLIPFLGGAAAHAMGKKLLNFLNQ